MQTHSQICAMLHFLNHPICGLLLNLYLRKMYLLHSLLPTSFTQNLYYFRNNVVQNVLISFRFILCIFFCLFKIDLYTYQIHFVFANRLTQTRFLSLLSFTIYSTIWEVGPSRWPDSSILAIVART